MSKQPLIENLEHIDGTKELIRDVLESKGIDGFKFVWFTDGLGWISARNNLKETFDVLDTVYNINDLENGILERII